MTMPAFYIPHGGGPCFFMDWSPPDTWKALGDWMRGIPAALPAQPKALLVFSAHWEQPQFTLLSTRDPALYYDYYDFPPHTYELQWPAPPAPEQRDKSLLQPAPPRRQGAWIRRRHPVYPPPPPAAATPAPHPWR